MHAYDVIAYVGDGEILCDECGERYDDESEDCEVSPIFGDNESDAIGATCGECGACYVIDYGWMDHESAVDPLYVRWAVCRECNSHYPYDKDGFTYRRDRKSALYGKLVCSNCMKPTVHF